MTSNRTPRAFPGRVIFDHLAKTAGQAVNAWLIGELGAGCVTPNIVGEHRTLVRQYGGNYSIISGHIGFYPGDQLDPRYAYITLLREPGSRVMSWIRFLLGQVPHDAETGSLIEGARRFLDTDGADATPEFLHSIRNLATEHFCVIGHAAPLDDREKVEVAIQNLREYRIVGVQERLLDFAGRVAEMLQIPRPAELPRVNVTLAKKSIGDVSPALRRRIEQLNELDAELYARVIDDALDRSTPGDVADRVDRFPWTRYDGLREEKTDGDASIRLVAPQGGRSVRVGERIDFAVDVDLTRAVRNLVIGIHVFDIYGSWAFGSNTDLLDRRCGNCGPGRYRATFSIAANLPIGNYVVGFAANEQLPEAVVQLAWYNKMSDFQVVSHVEDRYVGYSFLDPTVVVERCP